MPAESSKILQIDFQNPQFTRTDDWARAIGAQQFPFADYEWTQVLAPGEEYDQFELVGATGCMINPHYSNADLPLTHPFLDASSEANVGSLPRVTDWEFDFALDKETSDYRFLLAAGNEEAAQNPDSNLVKEAAQLGLDITKGALGVEIDSGLVPAGFKAGARSGERVAVFGRWTVDTAHKSPRGSFRSEIHPPLLMARASVQPLASAQPGTRVLFTSRPYLVGQRFTQNPDQIYKDAGDDDGPTLAHLAKQYAKISSPVIPLSFQLTAHPKIKSHPFLGAHLLHLKVRPPEAGGGRHVGGMRPRLAVSFQFTVRKGCAVQVSSSAPDTVDVLISLSHGGYTPPPLPHRRSMKWKRDEFDALRKGIGLDILLGEAGGAVLGSLVGLGALDTARVALILENGIEIDLYDPLPAVDINGAEHAVTRAWANEVSPGAGIVQNNDQPFPVFGWLEATWQLSGRPM